MHKFLSTLKSENYAYYLLAMLAPVSARLRLASLLMLSHELHGIPHKVSEDMLAFIRFAWWRETIALASQGNFSRRHPITELWQELMAGLPLEAPESNAFWQAATELVDQHEQAFEHKQTVVDATLLPPIAEGIFLRSSKNTAKEWLSWQKKARHIFACQQQHPITPRNIGLLLRLLF